MALLSAGAGRNVDKLRNGSLVGAHKFVVRRADELSGQRKCKANRHDYTTTGARSCALSFDTVKFSRGRCACAKHPDDRLVSIRLARGRDDAFSRRHTSHRQLVLHPSRFVLHPQPAQFADQFDEFVRYSLLRQAVGGFCCLCRMSMDSPPTFFDGPWASPRPSFSQEALWKTWLTPRASGPAFSPAIFCPSAVSSVACSFSISNCFCACSVDISKNSEGDFTPNSF